MANNNGPDIDSLKKDADRKQREANDDLDAVRRGKRHTSQQTAPDVERDVLQRSKSENWAAER